MYVVKLQLLYSLGSWEYLNYKYIRIINAIFSCSLPWNPIPMVGCALRGLVWRSMEILIINSTFLIPFHNEWF